MAIAPEFDRAEAIDLLTMCTILGGTPVPVIPAPPAGWTSVSISMEFPPFDNKWQLWRRTKDGAFAVVIRGTVETWPAASLEDLLSVLIDRDRVILHRGILVPVQVRGVAACERSSWLRARDAADSGLSRAPRHRGRARGKRRGPRQPDLHHRAQPRRRDGDAVAFPSAIRAGAAPEGDLQDLYVLSAKAGKRSLRLRLRQTDFPTRASPTTSRTRSTGSRRFPLTVEFIGDLNVPNPLSVMGRGAHLASVAMSPAATATAAVVAQGRHEIAARQIARVRPAAEMLIRSRLPPAAVLDAATLAKLPPRGANSILAQLRQCRRNLRPVGRSVRRHSSATRNGTSMERGRSWTCCWRRP